MMRLVLPLMIACLAIGLAWADGPGDNIPEKVRPVPPAGDKISDADRTELQNGLSELQALIKQIGKHDLLADLLIYEKAVRWALEYNEVFGPKNSKSPANNVKAVLKSGLERAKALKEGKTPWTTATGLVVRGYTSKIDGSVQPYGLVVPKEYDRAKPARLDFWWHGRGETLSEANFIADREKNTGQFTPPGAIVVHPYGRYCNANKFAGEIDSLEILEHVKKHYSIDESRIVARGFSMGGAACWQYAVHYPTLFCAAAPGAGFSETKEFLNIFQNETVKPTWYEEKLWRMYDATVYSQNLFNLPTVAYSGEVDKQKQAADVMAREMKKVGLELTHIIGPKTGHSYEKGAKLEVDTRINAFVEKGLPKERKEIKFVTYTLRYPEVAGFTVLGLEKHWEKGSLNVVREKDGWTITTSGITALAVPLPENSTKVTIDGTEVMRGRTWATSHLHAIRDPQIKLWRVGEVINRPGLHKLPGLQGPIDDAFMDSFLFVVPSRACANPTVEKWVKAELEHAQKHWRQQFRGDLRIKKDTDVTAEDIQNHHLILWGDTQSNQYLAGIADKLPIRWGDKQIQVGDKTFDSSQHVPVAIYPNPKNSRKYVVLNSGFTFREYDYLNNARQVPKLPDYAIIDITTPPNSRYPGKVVLGGFFDEEWQLTKSHGQ
jgi:hypothetical protein